jgi:methyl-accepting chemotaxis protein WspA
VSLGTSAAKSVQHGFLRSIAGRLLLWFLALALVPLAVLGVVTTRMATSAVEQAVRDNLVKVAAAKSAELERYASERLSDASGVASVQGLRRSVAYMTRPEGAEWDGPVPGPISMKAVTQSLGYRHLFVVDLSGKVLLSSDDVVKPGDSAVTGAFAGTELAAGIGRARILLQMEMTPFEKYTIGPEPLAFIVCPIMNDGGIVGVLAAALGPERFWAILGDATGLGETGELLACRRIGAELAVTAPLRLVDDAAFRMRIAPGSPMWETAAAAASGGRGWGAVTDYRGEVTTAAWCYLPTYRWGIVVKQDANEAYAMVTAQERTVLALGATIAVAVAAAAFAVARSISTPLRTAVAVANRVADGDLRADVGTPAKDETGALLEGIRGMTEDLRTLIGRIKESSATLGAVAASIAQSTEAQREIAGEHGASTSQAVAAARQISATSQELARTMDQVDAVASGTRAKAAEGRHGLAEIDGAMARLERGAGTVSATLGTISERAAGVNAVVAAMVNVANQTNLLSINASIEAEAAGEHGRGFRVVAQEVARLADRTAAAALEIERMVRDMQASVGGGVREMGAFSEEVRRSAGAVTRVSGRLADVIADVESISRSFGEVAEGMRAQATGADQIRDAMRLLADGAQRTAMALEVTVAAADELRTAVGGLDREVSRFRT